MRVTVIGCGNIGGALICGLVDGEHELCACDTKVDSIDGLEIAIERDVDVACKEAEVIVVAVKPKDIAGVLQSVGKAATSAVIISVAAGVSVAEISTALGKDLRVVRVMPNLPMSVSCGVSSIYSADSGAASIAASLFSAVGTTVLLETEELLAIATGLAGSGPAFVFSFCEALAAAGEERGLEAEQALAMAVDTVRGAAELMRVSNKSPSELITAVATPGGTTMAGLEALSGGKFKECVKAAVFRAADRADEKLSK